MKETEAVYQYFLKKKRETEENLRYIESELSREDQGQKSLIVKKIRGNLYYYTQWKENEKLCTRYVCPVSPGAAADVELQIERRETLLEELQEQQLMQKYAEQMLKLMEKDRKKQRVVEDYSFEVFWKDELTARVHVKGKNVRVSRYTDHPLKQLFAETCMTRHQLNRVFELRCWERERPDIDDILHHLGLEEYNPSEIVRKTHGVSYNDYIWFRFPGEKLTSKDVLVR